MCVCNLLCFVIVCFFFFKQKTAYEMRISDWSSDVCSSDLEMVQLHEDIVESRKNAFGKKIFEQFEAEFASLFFSKNSVVRDLRAQLEEEIGRATCRERVCKYV